MGVYRAGIDVTGCTQHGVLARGRHHTLVTSPLFYVCCHHPLPYDSSQEDNSSASGEPDEGVEDSNHESMELEDYDSPASGQLAEGRGEL